MVVNGLQNNAYKKYNNFMLFLKRVSEIYWVTKDLSV